MDICRRWHEMLNYLADKVNWQSSRGCEVETRPMSRKKPIECGVELVSAKMDEEIE
jgi:hypothetical protein